MKKPSKYYESEASAKGKMKKQKGLAVVIHFIKGSDFYDDYISATVELDGKILKEFGNYYHDKGEERAESFAEGYAMALGIDTDSITKNNKADKPRIE